MLCPYCNVSLAIEEAEGHIGFVCEKCQGIWLPHKYLISLRHNYIFEPQSLLAELASCRAKTPRGGDCPSCGKALDSSRVKGIELEWCERCNGVWFDQHELTKLVTFQNQLTPTQQAVEDASTAVQVVGSLLELISGA